MILDNTSELTTDENSFTENYADDVLDSSLNEYHEDESGGLEIRRKTYKSRVSYKNDDLWTFFMLLFEMKWKGADMLIAIVNSWDFKFNFLCLLGDPSIRTVESGFRIS